jgi:hypothetical protein
VMDGVATREAAGAGNRSAVVGGGVA